MLSLGFGVWGFRQIRLLIRCGDIGNSTSVQRLRGHPLRTCRRAQRPATSGALFLASAAPCSRPSQAHTPAPTTSGWRRHLPSWKPRVQSPAPHVCQPIAHVHTMHTNIRRYIHTHKHTYKQTYINTCIHTSYTQTYMYCATHQSIYRTRSHTHTHAKTSRLPAPGREAALVRRPRGQRVVQTPQLATAQAARQSPHRIR